MKCRCLLVSSYSMHLQIASQGLIPLTKLSGHNQTTAALGQACLAFMSSKTAYYKGTDWWQQGGFPSNYNAERNGNTETICLYPRYLRKCRTKPELLNQLLYCVQIPTATVKTSLN